VSRHDRDGLSLMGGLLMVLVAGMFLLDDLTSVEVDGRWVGPAVLIAVGLAGLASTLRSARAESEQGTS
jgi:hypothetical protein